MWHFVEPPAPLRATRIIWMVLYDFVFYCQWAYPAYFRAFHRFGQAKFTDGWVNFRLEPIFNNAPAASKNTARFKSDQIDPKIIISLR